MHTQHCVLHIYPSRIMTWRDRVPSSSTTGGSYCWDPAWLSPLVPNAAYNTTLPVACGRCPGPSIPLDPWMGCVRGYRRSCDRCALLVFHTKIVRGMWVNETFHAQLSLQIHHSTRKTATVLLWASCGVRLGSCWPGRWIPWMWVSSGLGLREKGSVLDNGVLIFDHCDCYSRSRTIPWW